MRRTKGTWLLGLGCAALIASCVEGAGPEGELSLSNPPARAVQVGKPAASKVSAVEEQFSEPFTDGAAQFERVKEMLAKEYYVKLDDDALYRAAVRGLLEYGDPGMRPWNALLSPKKMKALEADLEGSIVGVGIRIGVDEDTGLAQVIAPIAGSPSDKAGIEPGDIIVRIDDVVCQGEDLGKLISRIRGEAGTTVSLTVLRKGELVTKQITREQVKLQSVEHLALPNDIGYLRIDSFHKKSEPLVRRKLEELASGSSRGLVVDLRNNRGGSFSHTVSTADLLLPKGALIVTTRSRKDGEMSEKRLMSEAEPVLSGRPVVVLTSSNTGSGAEMVAVALRAAGASLVGATTHGKWSAQWLEKLDNGYGVKFTVTLVEGADGNSYEGVGVRPDLEVQAGESPCGKCDPAELLERDPVLRTAHQLLRRN